MTPDDIKSQARNLFANDQADKAAALIYHAIRDRMITVDDFEEFITDVQTLTVMELMAPESCGEECGCEHDHEHEHEESPSDTDDKDRITLSNN